MGTRRHSFCPQRKAELGAAAGPFANIPVVWTQATLFQLACYQTGAANECQKRRRRMQRQHQIVVNLCS